MVFVCPSRFLDGRVVLTTSPSRRLNIETLLIPLDSSCALGVDECTMGALSSAKLGPD